MTAKEYLKQAYRLDARIKSDLEELSELRKLACGVSSPGFEPRYNPNAATAAPFVKCLERIELLEKHINDEIDRFVSLKADIRDVISEVSDHDQQMLLRYRYIHFYPWEKITAEMHYSNRWIHTLHGRSLKSAEAVLKRKGALPEKTDISE